MTEKQLTTAAAWKSVATQGILLFVVLVLMFLPIFVHDASPSCGGWRARVGLEQGMFHQSWWMFTVLNERLDFRGLRLWDVTAIFLALLFTSLLWLETKPNEVMRPLSFVGFLSLGAALYTALMIGLGHEHGYHFGVIALVTSFTGGDLLTYLNRGRHLLFLQLAVVIDLPIILSYFLLVLYLDAGDRTLDTATRVSFISGAVAFQLILGSFALLVMRWWWGADSEAPPFLERLAQYRVLISSDWFERATRRHYDD